MSRPGWLYIMSDGTGPWKVGRSKNEVEERRDAGQTFNPRKLHVVSRVWCPDVVVAEAKAHRILAAHRRGRGEWFDCTLRQAMQAVAVAAGGGPLLRLQVWIMGYAYATIAWSKRWGYRALLAAGVFQVVEVVAKVLSWGS